MSVRETRGETGEMEGRAWGSDEGEGNDTREQESEERDLGRWRGGAAGEDRADCVVGARRRWDASGRGLPRSSPFSVTGAGLPRSTSVA